MDDTSPQSEHVHSIASLPRRSEAPMQDPPSTTCTEAARVDVRWSAPNGELWREALWWILLVVLCVAVSSTEGDSSASLQVPVRAFSPQAQQESESTRARHSQPKFSQQSDLVPNKKAKGLEGVDGRLATRRQSPVSARANTRILSV